MSIGAWLRRLVRQEATVAETRMSEDEVLARARAAVEAEGRAWQEPIQVNVLPGVRGGQPTWEVITNASMIGSNVKVWIDDETGRVKKLWILPR